MISFCLAASFIQGSSQPVVSLKIGSACFVGFGVKPFAASSIFIASALVSFW